MSDVPSPGDPSPSSPEELERQRAAERHGDPYLLYRDGDGGLQILSLPGSWEQITIGRSTATEVSIQWDPEVSTYHAQLERVGDDWALSDDGLSRNGSFVNGEKVGGRRLLYNGDKLRFGRTQVTFHAPLQVYQQTVLGTPDDDDG